MPAKGIQNLFDDGQGGILFTCDKGHFRYSNGVFLPVEIKSNTPDSRIVYFDSQGGIWLMGKDDLRRIIGGETINYQIKQHPEFGDLSVFEDKFGSFWIGQQNEFLRRIYINEIQEFSFKFDKTIPKFAEDLQGNLWIGNFDKIVKIGVEAVESADILNEEITIFTKKDELPGGNILSISGGREGNVWAGSVKGGLVQIIPQDIKVFSGEDWNSPDETVYPIYEDSGENIWLGVWSATLVKYSGGELTAYRNQGEANLITSIFEDSQKNLWIGKAGGIFIFKNGEFINMNEAVGFSDISGVLTMMKRCLISRLKSARRVLF